MSYGDLTEAEQAHWDEYQNLRGISDWPGFDDAQDERRQAARDWLVNQRKEIWRCAEGKKDDCEPGWGILNRQARYDFLGDGNLNNGAPKHEVRLPCPGSATDAEKSYIEEREVYLAFGSQTDAQKARKQANVDWLVARRKELWRLIDNSSDSENKANGRSDRYQALCIATHYGDAYEQWEKTHNKWGVPYSSKSTRSDCVKRARNYLGTSESPPESNRGKEVDDWNKRVYGSTGVPWCACYSTCMVWDTGVTGASSAGVAVIVDMARKGQGIFRGWTTDPGRVHKADMAVIGCTSCHIGLVDSSPYDTVEGNTSPGSEGSQYNGGCVADRTRKSEVVGWALVRWPD